MTWGLQKEQTPNYLWGLLLSVISQPSFHAFARSGLCLEVLTPLVMDEPSGSHSTCSLSEGSGANTQILTDVLAPYCPTNTSTSVCSIKMFYPGMIWVGRAPVIIPFQPPQLPQAWAAPRLIHPGPFNLTGTLVLYLNIFHLYFCEGLNTHMMTPLGLFTACFVQLRAGQVFIWLHELSSLRERELGPHYPNP